MNWIKKIYEQFGQWSVSDFVLSLLAALIIIPTSVVLGSSALLTAVGVLVVPCMILAYKNTALGYCALTAILAVYGAAVYSLSMPGSLIMVVGLIAPVLIFRIVKLFVSKLSSASKTSWIELVILLVLLAASAYPIYLLMLIVESGFAVIETISLVIALGALFLEVRGSKFATLIYPILTALQLVVYVLLLVDVHISVVPITIGIILALIVQVFNTVKLCKNCLFSKTEDSEEQ